MKKIVAILLCVLLLSVSTTTHAAGKLSVEQENFIVVNGYSNYGYAFAKVSNGGDKPIKINAGVLEIYNEAGDVLTSSDYLSAYAEYLEPGEYTYVKMYSKIETGTASDYTLTLTGKTDNSKRTMRLPAETDLQLDVKDGWRTRSYMYATVTNNTEEPVYGIKVALVLLDADGNILDIEDESLYNDKALTPGSSMIIREEILSSYLDYYKAKGIVPASVDAIAYVNVDAK